MSSHPSHDSSHDAKQDEHGLELAFFFSVVILLMFLFILPMNPSAGLAFLVLAFFGLALFAGRFWS
jgi:hypothetical protein